METSKNYLKNCLTLDEAKKLYFELAKALDPDRNKDRDTTAMFEDLANQFQAFRPATENEKFKGEFEQWNAKEFAFIIEQLINLPGIVIECIGSFVWVSGETKQHKELSRP